MTSSAEDLEYLYDTYSDEEILRLYTSGNLTEVAAKVALHQIKLRKLSIPVDINGGSDSLEEKSKPEYEMTVIANNLRFDEAIILSELMIAEGITSDTQGSSLHNAFFPSGMNHLVRVDARHYERASTIYTQFKNDRPQDNPETADETPPLKFTELSEEEQQLVRQVEMKVAMYSIGIIAIVLLVVFNSNTIIQIIAPYWSANVSHGLVLLISIIVLKTTVSTHERGAFKGPHGQETSKDDQPIPFWFEVIGGYILFGFLFIFGIQYFFHLKILPTEINVYEDGVKVILKVILHSFK